MRDFVFAASASLRRGPDCDCASGATPFKQRRACAPGISLLVAALLLAGVIAPLRAEPVNIPGLTEAFLDVTLSASVPGIVAARKFKEGDFVQAGEAILELDKRLEELEAERRKVVLDTRRVDFEGTAKLFKTSKGVSKEELEKKEADYKLAVVEHEMAVEQLRRRVVAAPLSGSIVEFYLQVGESCQPYQSLVRVVDTRRCYFVCNLDAQMAGTLKLEQPVQLALETSGAAVTVRGTLAFLSPIADPASGLIKVKVLFDNADAKVRPGLSGRLQLN